MSGVMLVVGTRKGTFIVEADADRADWSLRGPYCESWPTYHAVLDSDSGSIFVAAESAWHGPAVWRSGDLGGTWSHSSRGLSYEGSDGLELSKVSGLATGHGRLYVGAEAAGLFVSEDGGESFSRLTTLDDQPGREAWNVPSNQPPGRLGMPGLLIHPTEPDRLWVVVQGFGIFATEDGGATWEPRNRGLRSPIPNEDPDIGYCVHKLVASPADPERLYQQNHCGIYRSHDAGRSWTEVTEGLPTDFGFAAAAHPFDRDTFYVIPLDPLHERYVPGGSVAVWQTTDAGSSWQRLDRGLPQQDAYLGVLREGMAVDSLDVPGIYFGTSTGELFASTDEGRTWSEIARYLPGIASVEAAVVD